MTEKKKTAPPATSLPRSARKVLTLPLLIKSHVLTAAESFPGPRHLTGTFSPTQGRSPTSVESALCGSPPSVNIIKLFLSSDSA